MNCGSEGHLGPLSEGARRPLALEYLTVCNYKANGSATARHPQGKVYSVPRKQGRVTYIWVLSSAVGGLLKTGKVS